MSRVFPAPGQSRPAGSLEQQSPFPSGAQGCKAIFIHHTPCWAVTRGLEGTLWWAGGATGEQSELDVGPSLIPDPDVDPSRVRWRGQPRGWVSAEDSGVVASRGGPAEVLIWEPEQAGLE